MSNNAKLVDNFINLNKDYSEINLEIYYHGGDGYKYTSLEYAIYPDKYAELDDYFASFLKKCESYKLQGYYVSIGGWKTENGYNPIFDMSVKAFLTLVKEIRQGGVIIYEKVY